MSTPCQCGSLLEYHENYGKCENCDCREWKECYHDNRQFWCRECVEEPLRAENERLKAQLVLGLKFREDLERKLAVAKEALKWAEQADGVPKGVRQALKYKIDKIDEEPK